ncbi:hypothetical protein J3R82DRAFT_5678 [Butyriboletus roseoflavus]|nr:hypothetical protein J3R82DRAFT_5678 [Butyriboletus roseoflavus]
MAQNPFDRRRINGPEESFPPVFEPGQERSAVWNARCGRQSTDIRPICRTCT